MNIEKIETKTQEVTFLFTIVGSLSVLLLGGVYLTYSDQELFPITGNAGIFVLDGLFSTLGYSAFFLSISILHVGRFLMKYMPSIAAFKSIYRRFFKKTLFEIGAVFLLASLLTVLQSYWQIDDSLLLTHGAGGHIGNLIGGILFSQFGLYGALTILLLTLLISLISTGQLHLVSLILSAQDQSKKGFQWTLKESRRFGQELLKDSSETIVKAQVWAHKEILARTEKDLVFLKPNSERLAPLVVEEEECSTPEPTQQLPVAETGIIDATIEDAVFEIVPPLEEKGEVAKPEVIEEVPAPARKKKTKRKPTAKKADREKVAAKTEESSGESDVEVDEATRKAIAVQPYKKRYKFPSSEILSLCPEKDQISKEELSALCKDLEERLVAFGINGEVTSAHVGARLTMYEFKPAQGIRLSKLNSLTDDLALMLGADSIRILAPIPGTTTVGIEVPNKVPQMVMMGSMLKELKKSAKTMNLPIAVGKDVYNKTIVEDISKMPHMMVSGTTGSGKSVFINNLVVSLLYTQSPKDLRFIMIDPKMIELSPYNGIPHLLKPVVTDLDEAKDALVWAQNEMDRRYQVFAEIGARDIRSFNAIINKHEKKFFERKTKKNFTWDWNTLPQIIVIVDELADLMITQGKDVEIPITRIAQKARAAGIHLIIATQRPSAEVVTGLIKTNFPTRTAFKVSSSIDSRTILDTSGAEKLLGNGDMLFMAQGKSISRFQSAYISEEEVQQLVEEVSS